MFAGNELDKLRAKMQKNFDELFLKQDLLLEKLQMDENDMESKISDMFEKLIDTIEKKRVPNRLSFYKTNLNHNTYFRITMSPKDVKTIEQLVRNLANNARKNLQTIGNSVNALMEKVDNCNGHVDVDVFEQLARIQEMCQLNANLRIVSANNLTAFSAKVRKLRELFN